MCRLLGFSSREPVGFDGLLSGAFKDFVDLSCRHGDHRHGDGWGLSWIAEGGTLSSVKSPEAACESPAFAEEAAALRSPSAILHFRWATPGLPLQQENTHPFLRGQMAFAHNGSISDKHRLKSEIAPDLLTSLEGTTDSELLFLYILTVMREGFSEAQAIAESLGRIRRDFHHSGLNCILLTPDALHAACLFDPSSEIVSEMPDYYDLHYRVTPTSVVVASTGWEADRWPTLQNGQVLTIDRSALAAHVTDVN